MNGNNKQQRSEETLVRSIVQGNTADFAIIISNTERLVTSIVFKMIDNAEDRKDIMQDIYVKAFKNLAEFKFRAKLLTWIGHIAYNTCVNYLEKKKLVLLGASPEQKEESDHLPETLLFKKELAGILTAGIDRLPPLYRTILVLYHHEDLSYVDIAGITGLPAGTVKSYLFRARKKLKENILKNYKKEEL